MADETTEINTPQADDLGADEGQQQAGAAELNEVEKLASEMGWRPEADYTGPKDKWKPAKDFILTEREINRGMKGEIRTMREQIDRMASASSKQTERALKRQADELQARFAAAVESGDVAAAAKVTSELRDLERDAIDAAPTRNVEQDFAARNTWYGKDDEATAYAISVCQREAAKGKSTAEQLEAVDVAIRKRFPELVGGEGKVTPKPATVNAPGRPPAKREKGYSDLPPAVRDAADKYAKLFKDKHGLDPEQSKKEYASDYWSAQAA